jgi:tRNA A37 methylthiotransferase MiaB
VIGNYVEKNKEVKNVDEYSSFFIRICDGCMWNCTYCAIKRAVGDLRSKPIDICVKELKKGLSEGYTEFIIEADDSGAYGVDIGLTIVDLLKLMVKQKGDYKINLRSINPFWVVKYIDDLVLICKSGKIKGFQIPVQSGSPKVLKTMKRYTDTKKLAKALRQIRETGVKLTTDIIVGFPGETKKDVELTFDFIKEANLDSIFLVPYARMKGTESYDMKQVPKEESLKRIEYLKKELGDSKIEVLKEYKWSLFHYLSRI